MTENDGYVVDAPPLASLPIAGGNERFPIRRVFCVGRNYADHAREMGADPDREPPFFFSKPTDAVFAAIEGAPRADGPRCVAGVVPYPSATNDLQFEIELVVAIGVGGTSIAPGDALAHVWGYGVGVDLTRRDLQAQAKELRRPWDLSKGFDASGPCSALVPASVIGHPDHGSIWLAVNGAERQRGDLSDQIWPVADLVSELSNYVTLGAGDVIFTGTPSGVGTIVRGDAITAGIDGVGDLDFTIR
ncbi:MAG: fumarylacetoacetate hydrolase family protein [Glaciihabitans sp.]|nr:fumarylacetoacetate hydrolase family protein [Glaciihabitans sp.]